jgi:hypothetical protein
MNQKLFTWGLAASIWGLNPVISGCDPSNNNLFTFGEVEMLDLMDDLNDQSWEIEFEGSSVEVLVDLDQVQTEASAALLLPTNSAYACGSRSFLASAEACLDDTSLLLEGSISIFSEGSEEPETFVVSGSIFVIGYDLDNARVSIHSDDIEVVWNGTLGEEDEQLQLEISSLSR